MFFQLTVAILKKNLPVIRKVCVTESAVAISGKRVHHFHQARLEVRSLTFVDHIFLGQFIKHGSYTGQHFCGFFLVLGGPDVFEGVTHGFGLVTVALLPGFVRTDAFFG